MVRSEEIKKKEKERNKAGGERPIEVGRSSGLFVPAKMEPCLPIFERVTYLFSYVQMGYNISASVGP